jgi:hypothetical protein
MRNSLILPLAFGGTGISIRLDKLAIVTYCMLVYLMLSQILNSKLSTNSVYY